MKPLHPGVFIQRTVLAPRGINVTDAAAALGVSRVNLSRFLHGHVALSPDMAIRFSKAFGLDWADLLHRQHAVELWDAERRVGKIRVEPWEAAS
jgi:addiction module HigA family antidote